MEPHPNTIRARALRSGATSAERLLWSRLRSRRLGGLKWRRQYAIGPYFADFACLEHRLIVELDGSQHGETPAADQRRTEWLGFQGWRVIRVWNTDLFEDPDAVCEAVLNAVTTRELSPVVAADRPHPLPLRPGPKGLASSPEGEAGLVRSRARAMLWDRLRAKRLGGVKWRRWSTSASIPADFFTHAHRLAVVLDDGSGPDAARVARIKTARWRVLRVHPAEVPFAITRICSALRAASGVPDQGVCEDPSPFVFDPPSVMLPEPCAA